MAIPAIRFSVMSWNAKPIARPTIPAPANNEVTVPRSPIKSSAIKIPAVAIATLIMEVSKPTICVESKVRDNTRWARLPTILANSPKAMAIKMATAILGRCLILASTQRSSFSLISCQKVSSCSAFIILHKQTVSHWVDCLKRVVQALHQR